MVPFFNEKAGNPSERSCPPIPFEKTQVSLADLFSLILLRHLATLACDGTGKTQFDISSKSITMLLGGLRQYFLKPRREPRVTVPENR